MRIPGFPTLTFRKDSLLVQCCVAASLWFAPPDAVTVAGLYWFERQNGRRRCPTSSTPSIDDSLAKFLKQKKGTFCVDVQKNKTFVSLRA
ncbi:hypothetical protein cyc_06882 [Cyclospora cayetanensis]|uniref:Uncharacterized protein n=1 Tax=Cyclospora cayetanensis TaxID=88456 RepID=A0A1D3D2F8_9EIME|nr:hypothetical protein cyc_06882 [Cyclospora cayetanensis]